MDGINGVRKDTGHHGDGVADGELGGKVVLDRSRHVGRDRVVQAKVEAAVDDDSHARDDKAAVQTDNAVSLEGLGVHVDEALVLALAAASLGGLGVVGQLGTGVVERVHKAQRGGTGGTTRGQVHGEPKGVALLLLGGKQSLKVILKGKVERLRGKVTQHVGAVGLPERAEALSLVRAGKAVNDTLVRSVNETLLEHLSLVLHHHLDALDGGRNGLGHGRGGTAHHKVLEE